jgi:hypothetical protein
MPVLRVGREQFCDEDKYCAEEEEEKENEQKDLARKEMVTQR